MIESTINMTSLYKERNKLVMSSNFISWKKMTDLILIENEVIGHVKGSINESPK